MPHIVITNDDGIAAPGLRALVKGIEGMGNISIVAPSYERSAAAQSLTLRQPIYCDKVADNEWAIEGTPADAMIVAFHALFPTPPDLVISGINRGSNLGENIYYSGTVGAAMEAAINKVPALAVSLLTRGRSYDFEPAAKFVRKLIPIVLKEGLPSGVLLNINIPPKWNGKVRFTRQSSKITRNVLQPGQDPRGRTYYWLREQEVTDGIGSDTDYAAIFANEISITPLHLDHTDTPSLNHLSHWAKFLSE